MKELLIEKKAKAYDEALERAREIKKGGSGYIRGLMEDIFPELKESEDERIRKEIINYFRCQSIDEPSRKDIHNKWISWLEKQGETDSSIKWHNVSEIPEEDREILCECVDSDCVKWHEVAFYHANSKTFWTGYKHIKNVTRWCYIDDLENQGEQKETLCDRCRKEQSSHSCQDITALGRCALEYQGKQKPADEVKPKFNIGDTMRTLEEASKGITNGLPVVVSIDNEYYHCNNELIAIKDQNDYEYPAMNRRQKPAWSEEDENKLEEAIYYIRREPYIEGNIELIVEWLRALKDRVQPQQEWSQNDIDMIDQFILCCKEEHDRLCNDKYGHQDIVSDLKRDCNKKWDWLESLKNRVVPQNRWKPSEEQLDALETAISSLQSTALESLFNDLKKLKD